MFCSVHTMEKETGKNFLQMITCRYLSLTTPRRFQSRSLQFSKMEKYLNIHLRNFSWLRNLNKYLQNTAFEYETTDTLWSRNLKRSIVSQFQVDLKEFTQDFPRVFTSDEVKIKWEQLFFDNQAFTWFIRWEFLASAKLRMLSCTEENLTAIHCVSRKTHLDAKVPSIGTTICPSRAAHQLNQK